MTKIKKKIDEYEFSVKIILFTESGILGNTSINFCLFISLFFFSFFKLLQFRRFRDTINYCNTFFFSKIYQQKLKEKCFIVIYRIRDIYSSVLIRMSKYKDKQ